MILDCNGGESLKVLVICNDMQNGGVERVLSVLSNYLAEKGHNVRILAIRTGNISYTISNKVEYDFLPLRAVEKNETIKQEICMEVQLFKYMKKYKPDVMIGFDDSIIVRTVPIAWSLGIRTVVSERIDPSIYGKLMHIVRQFAYDLATHVVFQTPDAQAYFPRRTQRKSVVIPNPLTENLPHRGEKTNKDILMACRIRPQKNIAMAIKAFAKFWPEHQDYRLVVYGEGELLDDMKRLALELGVENNVSFPGHVDDIHERMSVCAMYLSSSDYEGISNSMLEALAIGAPCICTDCPVGGARMFIKNNENGLLVPVGDDIAMADAMSKIAADETFANKLSKNSVLVRDLLSPNRICPRWEILL